MSLVIFWAPVARALRGCLGKRGKEKKRPLRGAVEIATGPSIPRNDGSRKSGHHMWCPYNRKEEKTTAWGIRDCRGRYHSTKQASCGPRSSPLLPRNEEEQNGLPRNDGSCVGWHGQPRCPCAGPTRQVVSLRRKRRIGRLARTGGMGGTGEAELAGGVYKTRATCRLARATLPQKGNGRHKCRPYRKKTVRTRKRKTGFHRIR